MKMIIKLGGVAIGILSLFTAKIIQIQTKDSILSVKGSIPIQFILNKNRSQISSNFYPEFNEEYYLKFVPSSLIIADKELPSIPAPSIKVKLAVDDRNIQIYEYPSSSCDRNTCTIASFKSFANRKHTISIDTKNLDSRWYTFDPMLEANITGAHIPAAYIPADRKSGNEMKIVYLIVGGFSILAISFIMLVFDYLVFCSTV